MYIYTYIRCIYTYTGIYIHTYTVIIFFLHIPCIQYRYITIPLFSYFSNFFLSLDIDFLFLF